MTKTTKVKNPRLAYPHFLKQVSKFLEDSRKTAARSVNSIMTATYWEIGRRIVEFEQGGRSRAKYGEELILKLSKDLTKKFGRGFSRQNIQSMRQFFLTYLPEQICQTLSGESIKNKKTQTLSRKLGKSKSKTISLGFEDLTQFFKLSWSHYVRLVSLENADARQFYESEALRCGWSVRQLDRQVSTLFFERTLMSKNKKAMLEKGAIAKKSDYLTPEEEIRDPYVLEFLHLKDEYSENDLEEGLILHLEKFLLELGGDFTFVGRQKRLKIGGQWYRVDLVFFHRRLKSLVIVDLKVGKFTHADAGQMHMYLNYAKEHWTYYEANPPVGLILCAEKNHAVAKYALADLPNKVLTAEYKTKLPKEKRLVQEINKTIKQLEKRKI